MEMRTTDLKRIRVTDEFWKSEIELVRKNVIPYQWEALNDRVEGADPSFAMHNFRAAALLRERMEKDPEAKAPVFDPKTPFEVLPKEGEAPEEDRFYGFLFQDSDLYKWIEAVAYSLIGHPDPELERTCDGAIGLVARAQAPDGYLDTYYILNGRDREFTLLRENHELYVFGHLTEAAVAYHDATGKDVLLSCAEKFASYIRSKIGPEEGKKRGYPGHEIAEMALVRLYGATGKKEYLDLAAYFVNERGTLPYYFDRETVRPRNRIKGELPYAYYQAHLPVREQKEAVGHAVRAAYLYSGAADVARLTDDDALKDALRGLFQSIVREKMYVTGGIGGTHVGEAFSFPFDLPNDTAYAESCAAIGLVFFARRMLLLEPKAAYADVMERALYNGVLSGMDLTGTSFFYVNPLEVLPEAVRRDSRLDHVAAVRRKWFGCACCPPNIARLLSSVGAYAFTESDDTLFAHLYMDCEMEKTVSGQAFTLKETVEKAGGRLTVRFRAEGAPEDFVLALRKPGWCDEMTVDGPVLRETDGYVYVSRNWAEDPEVTVKIRYFVKILAADPRVRQDAHKCAVLYGPFVMALEEADNGKGLAALSVDGGRALQEARIGKTGILGREGVTVTLPGFRTEAPDGAGLYYDAGSSIKRPAELTFIPYFMWANRGENEMQVWTHLD